MAQTTFKEYPLLGNQQYNPELTWNIALQLVSAFTHPEIQDRSLATEPNPTNADFEKLWIIPDLGISGSSWPGNEGRAAIWVDVGVSSPAGGWMFRDIPTGIYYNSDTSIWEAYDGVNWSTATL